MCCCELPERFSISIRPWIIINESGPRINLCGTPQVVLQILVMIHTIHFHPPSLTRDFNILLHIAEFMIFFTSSVIIAQGLSSSNRTLSILSPALIYNQKLHCIDPYTVRRQSWCRFFQIPCGTVAWFSMNFENLAIFKLI